VPVLIGFEYIKYRWKAKGRHGIHSPFVYDFLDNCLRIKIDSKDVKALQELFSQLRADHRSFTIDDFGAGSKKLGAKRKVSRLLKMSSSKGKYGKLLYQLSKHYQFKKSLEFGTSIGIGTMYLSLGTNDGELTTIEACKNTREIALENIKQHSNVTSILSTFDAFLETQIDEKYDFIFIDGHHEGEALLRYLDRLKEFTHDDTIFVLDDIRWSQSMLDAWTSIIESSEYHVTLDLFRIGIIVRRSQQVKEHFYLKL
tara:strand:- start:179 stop:946 length:768 start_codon:yes stop_codon:yes gene_type:complete